MVISEMGINWNLENYKDRLDQVRSTGCTYVKFQLFHPDQVPAKLAHHALDLEAVIWHIQESCRCRGLTPLFTPMAMDLVRYCDRGHIKIRHKDRNNLPLIRAAQEHAQTVWVSGLSRLQPRGIFRPQQPRPVLCVPKYPATFEDYEEEFMAKPEAKDHDRTMWEGISSHLGGDVGNLIELAEECDIPKDGYFEAHVMFEPSDPEHGWSIPMEQLKDLVQWGNS